MSPYLYIVWHERFDSGVPILDEQHHGMVATINSLFFFIQEGWGLGALKPTLDLMQRYAGFHAKTEEGVLAKAGYEGIRQYQQMHKQFIEGTSACLDAAMEEQDPDLLLRFLKQWWVSHIELHDAQYKARLLTLGASR